MLRYLGNADIVVVTYMLGHRVGRFLARYAFGVLALVVLRRVARVAFWLAVVAVGVWGAESLTALAVRVAGQLGH